MAEPAAEIAVAKEEKAAAAESAAVEEKKEPAAVEVEKKAPMEEEKPSVVFARELEKGEPAAPAKKKEKTPSVPQPLFDSTLADVNKQLSEAHERYAKLEQEKAALSERVERIAGELEKLGKDWIPPPGSRERPGFMPRRAKYVAQTREWQI